MRKIRIFLCFSIVYGTIFTQLMAQEPESDKFNVILTQLMEQTDNESLSEDFATTVYDLIQNPVNINAASRKDLEQFFWLKSSQIDAIINYRNKYGSLQTTNELFYIPEFTEDEIHLLVCFIVIKPVSIPDSIKINRYSHIKQSLLLRAQRVLEIQDGYKPKATYSGSNYYTGNPWRYLTKYSFNRNDKIKAGITGEKDPGEAFFKDSNPNGFDFYSFYVQAKNYGFIKTMVIGDYGLQFGQGLIVNSKYSFGKSLSALNSAPSGSGISPFTSTNENIFFRGIASSVQYKNINTTLFYSNHFVDGNVLFADSANQNNIEFSSLQNTGIHGTPNEIADEKQINQMVSGMHVQYFKGNVELGATAVYTRLSADMKPDPDLYNMYYFKGNKNLSYGIDYRLRFRNILFFGEGGMSDNHGYAFLNGIQYYAGNRLGIKAIHRYYAKNYQSLHGNAFGENSKNQNEEGFFLAIECAPLKKITLSSFVDLYKFPWLRYQADMPSSGREYMVQINYKPNSNVTGYIQYRNKLKEENSPSPDEKKNILNNVSSERIRANFNYEITANIEIQNRIEFNTYKKEGNIRSNGVYISQDLNFAFNKIPVKVWLRYAVFDTQGYNNRIYSYENDVLYSFSVPAYSDKGTRSYIMLKYSPFRKFDFWIRYAITQYSNKNVISSGLSEIQGNKKSEIRLQVLYKF